MKSMLLLALFAAFILSSSAAFAAKSACTIDGVKGDKATITCKEGKDLKVGEKVNVATEKKKAPVLISC